jgi:hypothetical protein
VNVHQINVVDALIVIATAITTVVHALEIKKEIKILPK